MPAGWNCIGSCGTLGANGVVTLAPTGGTQYGYVSTVNAATGVNGPQGGGTLTGVTAGSTSGSRLTSSVFTATGGDILKFNFNYVTSDGEEFADYGWARLLDASMNQVAILFTARTTTSGNTVPGFGMPTPAATLTPASTPIISGAPAWSPLGANSSTCYGAGCGYTGWIEAKYSIASTGSYYLQFGVANYLDNAFATGMAFDGIKINDTPISTVPEPGSVILMGSGLVAVFAFARRRRREASAA
jgi:hypothetical protein